MKVSIDIKGTMPLLMHSQRAMNLRDPQARSLATLQKKRGKTEDDRLAISDAELLLGLYWDEEAKRIYIPSFNIIRAIQDGGKMLKLGKKIIQAVRADPLCINVPLLFPGCQGMTPEKLAELPEFRDVRTVTVGTNVVERTRPIFRDWALRPTFLLDTEHLGIEEFTACVEKGGEYSGLGDFRVGTPKGGPYGTFTATVSKA